MMCWQHESDQKTSRVLHEVRGADAPTIYRLMQTYVVDAPDLLQHMEQAISSGDIAELYRTAHALATQSAHIGAVTLSNLCQQVAVYCIEGSHTQAAITLVRVNAEATDVVRSIQILLATKAH